MALEFYDLYCEGVEMNERLVKENTSISKRYKATESRYIHLEKHIGEIIEKKKIIQLRFRLKKLMETLPITISKPFGLFWISPLDNYTFTSL